MNEQEVSELEGQYGKLPEDYKMMIQEFPESLRSFYAHEDFNFNKGIFDDVAVIKEVNDEVRKFKNTPWPPNYFVIGGDCGGNYYCIDLKKPKKTTVYFWCHEDDEFEKSAKDLASHIRDQFKQQAELTIDELGLY